MQFIYQYPYTRGLDRDMLDAGGVAEVAVAVEDAGFVGLGFTEHPAAPYEWLSSDRGHQSIDPFVALGCAAGVTTRIRLVTCLAVAPYRNPLVLAKAAATVDQLSSGRLILGLGTGYLAGELAALGVNLDERNVLFDEALDVLRLHWSGEPFSYRGRHFWAQDVIARPRPVQREIPIWIGGNARVSRERAAERAQGWMPMIGPAALTSQIRTSPLGSIDDLASELGRLRDRAARRGAALDLVLHYVDPEPAGLRRDAGRHAAAFAEFERVGVTHVVVVTPGRDRATTLDYVERFGATFPSTPPPP